MPTNSKKHQLLLSKNNKQLKAITGTHRKNKGFSHTQAGCPWAIYPIFKPQFLIHKMSTPATPRQCCKKGAGLLTYIKYQLQHLVYSLCCKTISFLIIFFTCLLIINASRLTGLLTMEPRTKLELSIKCMRQGQVKQSSWCVTAPEATDPVDPVGPVLHPHPVFLA